MNRAGKAAPAALQLSTGRLTDSTAASRKHPSMPHLIKPRRHRLAQFQIHRRIGQRVFALLPRGLGVGPVQCQHQCVVEFSGAQGFALVAQHGLQQRAHRAVLRALCPRARSHQGGVVRG